MNKRFFPAVILALIAAESIAALTPLHLPGDGHNSVNSAQKDIVLKTGAASARSKTVMPVFLDFLPDAQALQEGVPGVTATPQFSGNNPLAFAPVIPLSPEDLPARTDTALMRDAVGPASEGTTEATQTAPSWRSRVSLTNDPDTAKNTGPGNLQGNTPSNSFASATTPACVKGLFASSACPAFISNRPSGR